MKTIDKCTKEELKQVIALSKEFRDKVESCFKDRMITLLNIDLMSYFNVATIRYDISERWNEVTFKYNEEDEETFFECVADFNLHSDFFPKDSSVDLLLRKYKESKGTCMQSMYADKLYDVFYKAHIQRWFDYIESNITCMHQGIYSVVILDEAEYVAEGFEDFWYDEDSKMCYVPCIRKPKKTEREDDNICWNDVDSDKVVAFLEDSGFEKSFESYTTFQYSKVVDGYILNVNLDYAFYCWSDETQDEPYGFPDKVSVIYGMSSEYNSIKYVETLAELRTAISDAISSLI